MDIELFVLHSTIIYRFEKYAILDKLDVLHFLNFLFKIEAISYIILFFNL